MSSIALRNDTLIEISTFLIRRWSENDKIIVTMSPNKVNETRIKENKVISFKEKPPMEEVWVNGGFFVLEPQVFDYLQNDSTIWEKEPMEGLVKNNQLSTNKKKQVR